MTEQSDLHELIPEGPDEWAPDKPFDTTARIAYLEAERDRLREEVSRWQKQSNDWQTLGWKLGEENDKLKAVNVELRAALGRIAWGDYMSLDMKQIAKDVLVITKEK